MGLDDQGRMNNGRLKWYPLETVLQAWLDEIKSGKIKAARRDEDVRVEYFPWYMVPYTDKDLEEALNAYDRLVEAVETRIPVKTWIATEVEYGLVDETTLDQAKILDGFARRFLLRARRPQFKYYAPGLQVIGSETFWNNKFLSVFTEANYKHREEETDIPPILLFYSEEDYIDTKPPSEYRSRNNFDYPYREVERHPAGLYLNPVYGSFVQYNDASKLVLPFGIGGRRYARTSDGALYGENGNDEIAKAEDTTADLYQAGHRPFGEMHGTQLKYILQHWLMMVENGYWKVGPEGVMGGIQEWKKADRRGTWKQYVIPIR